MSRAIVAIGIDKTGGGLPVLHAAAVGATKVADWAQKQQFEAVRLLTDKQHPVTLSDISSAINGLVQERIYDQLIVYFSGHGLLKGPNYEIWLLSGAPDNPNEAVNLTGSIELARNCGISHVVFISDACRSIPNMTIMNYVTGGVIFPAEQHRPPSPEIDSFYATIPGDPALEVSPDKAVPQYRGIFTDSLMKALNGEVEGLAQQSGTKLVIPSRPVKKYLLSAVPAAASAVSITLQQDPEIRVESELPKYLSEIPDLKNLTTDNVTLRGVDSLMTHIKIDSVTLKSDSEILERYPEKYFIDPHTPESSMFVQKDKSIQRILKMKGRESFETRTGFTIHGAKAIFALTYLAKCDVFVESDLTQIRVNIDEIFVRSVSKRTHSAVIRFENGTGACLAVLPGYIGTVIVEDGRIVAVNYTPSKNSNLYRRYQEVADRIEKQRAFAAVAARNGSFRLEQDNAGRAAEYLRELKVIDPALGIYAAYAYNQAGNWDGVQSIFDYMSTDDNPVPFDVAMLAYRNKPWPEKYHYFPPSLPMLTQGWALLGDFEKPMPPVLLEVQNHLIPSLWTTFATPGIDILENAIQSGVIR